MNVDLPEAFRTEATLKTRSYSNKTGADGNILFNSKSSKESKSSKKQQSNKTPKASKKKEKKLSEMSPREITNLLKENQQLKEEIMRMQSLIQEVVPVFHKITEEIEEDSSIF